MPWRGEISFQDYSPYRLKKKQKWGTWGFFSDVYKLGIELALSAFCMGGGLGSRADGGFGRFLGESRGGFLKMEVGCRRKIHGEVDVFEVGRSIACGGYYNFRAKEGFFLDLGLGSLGRFLGSSRLQAVLFRGFLVCRKPFVLLF